MPGIKSLIKAAVPDGRFKDFLRATYRAPYFVQSEIGLKRLHLQIRNNNYTLRYSPEINGFCFSFKEKNLQNQSLCFPDTNFNTVRFTYTDMRGYFASGRVKPGMLVIDAGAFPGDFAVLAMQKGCSVIALEPDPDNKSYLEKLLKANNASGKVKVLDYGLSDTTSTVSLVQKSYGSFIIPEKDLSKHEHEKVIEIKTASLDNLLEEEGFFSPRYPAVFVKMDIEGQEIKALEGAKRAIAYGVEFAIAGYHLIDGQQSHHHMRRILEPKGYDVKIVNPKHLTLLAKPSGA